MNEFLTNNLIAIILFLLLIILLLIGVLAFFFYKMITMQPPKTPPPPKEPPAPKPFTLSKVEAVQVKESFFCIHHQDKQSVGSCLICEEVFCDRCLVEHESMHFCKEHFRVYANHKWNQITDVKTTPNNPEDGFFIYEFKRDIWINRNIPTFVMTHYKINTDNDYIESFIQLNVREEDVEKLKSEIQKYKARH